MGTPVTQRSDPGDVDGVARLFGAGHALLGREVLSRDLLNALPAAIYTTDARGKITFYNDAAVTFAGRRPAPGDRWCVTWKLYHLDGAPMRHDECPMAVAVKEARPVRGVDAIAERPDGTRLTFTPYPTPLLNAAGQVVGGVNMLVDITERRAAEERQRLLVNEVNHRANNLLAVVQSMVRIGKAETVEEFRSGLDGRILALSRAHNLLAKSRWTGADLQHLVTEELSPFMDASSRVWISGPILPMEPAMAQSMAMIVHELAANAVQHGALSAETGEVLVEWSRAKDDCIVFKWTETGCPAAQPESFKGVGSTVISRAAANLRADLNWAWTGQGLVFQLIAPMKRVGVVPLH